MTRTNPSADEVIAYTGRVQGTPCASCGVPLVGHDAVVGLMLGFSDEPSCLACLARHHDREPVEFIESSHRSVRRLACYRAGWRFADEQLAAAGPWPEERVPSRFRMPADDDDDAPDDPGVDPNDWDACVEASDELERWDAGDRGCGELALELRQRVRRLAPGARLLLTTTDRGAPADLPAWCRLTGNVLVAAAPPNFLVESRPRDPRQ